MPVLRDTTINDTTYGEHTVLKMPMSDQRGPLMTKTTYL